MSVATYRRMILASLAMVLIATAGWSDPIMERIAGEAPDGTIEIEGVAAGPFRPEWWEADTLN